VTWAGYVLHTAGVLQRLCLRQVRFSAAVAGAAPSCSRSRYNYNQRLTQPIPSSEEWSFAR
jgi:hypothetical protein